MARCPDSLHRFAGFLPGLEAGLVAAVGLAVAAGFATTFAPVPLRLHEWRALRGLKAARRAERLRWFPSPCEEVRVMPIPCPFCEDGLP